MAITVLFLGVSTSPGESDSFSISAFVYVDRYEPANEDYDSGVGIVTASQTANCDYEYSLYVYASAAVSGEVEDAILVSDLDPRYGGPSDSVSDNGTMLMHASDTIRVDGRVGAEADWITGPAHCSAYGSSSASVTITLSDDE